MCASTSILYSHVVLLTIRYNRSIRTYFLIIRVIVVFSESTNQCVYGAVLLFCWLGLWTVGEHTLCAIATTPLFVVSTSRAAMALIIVVI